MKKSILKLKNKWTLTSITLEKEMAIHSSTKKIFKSFNILDWEIKRSVQFSLSVASNSLRPHESQHARPPCPSPTPGVYSNSCPSSWWCHPAISSSVIPFSSRPQSLLISFRMDWLDLLAVQGTLRESSPTPQFKSINSSALSFLHSPTLTFIHDHWKNHSLD